MTVAVSRRDGESMLHRGLSLLDAFEQSDRALSLTELARRTGLPKATVFRLLAELVEWGALTRTGHEYRLGTRMFVMGEKVTAQTGLRDVARPFLQDLYEVSGENVSLGVLNGASVLYLVRVYGHGSSRVRLRAGDMLPAHSTSMGKAMLAHSSAAVVDAVIANGLPRLTPRTVVLPGVLRQQLRTVTERGYAVNSEETHVGVVSVAAAVFAAPGEVVAAVSVTGRVGRFDPPRLAPAVRTTALAVSRAVAANQAAAPAG